MLTNGTQSGQTLCHQKSTKSATAGSCWWIFFLSLRAPVQGACLAEVMQALGAAVDRQEHRSRCIQALHRRSAVGSANQSLVESQRGRLQSTPRWRKRAEASAAPLPAPSSCKDERIER